ncbi:hypothetical protein EVAR_90078_1 [Eumeta japonica]|uniref:Uncharacterized protein n=1 Tax=Eumeta variegata TaxID=151549 RepID=A0A4C1X255_EUMVA|nr:hypothetical protein EVAR_90078_1 [Eumeta japonica]
MLAVATGRHATLGYINSLFIVECTVWQWVATLHNAEKTKKRGGENFPGRSLSRNGQLNFKLFRSVNAKVPVSVLRGDTESFLRSADNDKLSRQFKWRCCEEQIFGLRVASSGRRCRRGFSSINVCAQQIFRRKRRHPTNTLSPLSVRFVRELRTVRAFIVAYEIFRHNISHCNPTPSASTRPDKRVGADAPSAARVGPRVPFFFTYGVSISVIE